jgi:hypothetical protein
MAQVGRVKKAPVQKITGPSKGVQRFFLTSAQNNTSVFAAAWQNILALAEHYDAKVIVAPFTYHKKLWAQSGEVTPGTVDETDFEEYWWDEAVQPYIALKPVQLGNALVFCAGTNILPTAVRPLSGLELHTGRKSAIYPHAKIEMVSVASGKMEGTKLMYTTGAVTKRNYLQKKAGQKAEQLHCYGGLIVEIDEAGSFWVRQVQADERGVIHDLDVKVEGGVVSTDNPVEGITWGDIHVAKADQDIIDQAFGDGGMLDTLQPRHQFFHDVFDMYARNHHDRRNPHRMFERMVEQRESLVDEGTEAGAFLRMATRDWCRSVVVKSNHDDAFERWLQSSDAVQDRDVRNLIVWHAENLDWLKAAAAGNTSYITIENFLKKNGCPPNIKFLRDDESYILCKGLFGLDGGIECGMHGHLGASGSRGTLIGFSKMGRRCNIGDKHAAGIMDGAYGAGVSGKLDMKYNKGPSTWSHSHIVTYPNGMRTIVTMWRGRWRG